MKSKILIIPFLFLIMTTKGGVEDEKPVQICLIAGYPRYYIPDTINDYITNDSISSTNIRKILGDVINADRIIRDSGDRFSRLSEYRRY